MAVIRPLWQLLLVFIVSIVLQTNFAYAIVATYCSDLNTSSEGVQKDDRLMSEGLCRTTCSGYTQYAFSITQGSKCWCSNIAPGDTQPLSLCNTLCPGYPVDEYCGSVHRGLYNYLALDRKPTGTSDGGYNYGGNGNGGGGGGHSFTPSPTPVTHTQTEHITRTIPKTITKSSVNTVRGSTVTRKSIVVTTRIDTKTREHTVVTSISYISKGTETLFPTISTRFVTISGQTSKQVVTTYIPAPPASGSEPQIKETHTGLSGGAIAGIVIGAVAALALIGALVYFCCCRLQSPRDESTENSGLGRNTSVLSKAGLIGRSSGPQQQRPPPTMAAASSTYTASSRPPRLQTDIPAVSSVGPSSAATGGTTGSRRDSRPLFVDQRLNPNALTVNPNASQTSFSSLHDDQDYSRPLEVRNPDPPSRLL